MNLRRAIGQEPTIFLTKKLWCFSRGMHNWIVLYLIMFVVANIIQLSAPLIFGAVIDEIQSHGIKKENLLHLTLLLSLFFVKTLVFLLFHGPARVIERLIAFQAEVNYRQYLIGGVLDLGLTWHGEHDSGNTIDKVNKAGDALYNFGENSSQIVEVVVKLLGTVAVLLCFSPWIGSLVFFLVIISFMVVFQFDKRLLPQYRVINEFNNRAAASVYDALSNVTTVKILHIEKPVLDGVITRFRDPYPLYRATAKLNEWKWFVGNMCFQGIGIIPLILYLYYAVINGDSIDAGSVSMLYLYLSDLVFVWFGFGSYYQQISFYKNRLLNAQPIEEIFAGRNATPRRQVAAWGYFSVTDLTFGYEAGPDNLNLNRVALEVKRGERIALIGESGSGKTTFLKVLHGMYPKAHALVSVDGLNPFLTSFADIDLKTMLVPQEPEIFSSTIRENITLGIDYSQESLMEAIRIAAFDQVIQDLPSGLESVINEKGVNLSGGQKQRLALARAILFSANKDIILLDESTSSVDVENETEIYQRIFDTFHDKTILASIHKMNLLKLFDRIVMFDDSRVVDTGTFEELLENNNMFFENWQRFVATN